MLEKATATTPLSLPKMAKENDEKSVENAYALKEYLNKRNLRNLDIIMI